MAELLLSDFESPSVTGIASQRKVRARESLRSSHNCRSLTQSHMRGNIAIVFPKVSDIGRETGDAYRLPRTAFQSESRAAITRRAFGCFLPGRVTNSRWNIRAPMFDTRFNSVPRIRMHLSKYRRKVYNCAPSRFRHWWFASANRLKS
jgi:hypothetical protein